MSGGDSQGEKRTAVRRRRRRRRSGGGFYYFLAVFLTAIGILICINVFCKVEYIEIEGLTKYAPQLVIDGCGIYEGDKLFRIKRDEVEKRLTDEFAYIESVRVKRKLPSTVVLVIEQCEPAACFRDENGYSLINTRGRLLEEGVAKPPAGVVEVDGLGAMPDKKDAGYEEYVETLDSYNHNLKAHGDNGITGVNFIDMTDRYDVTIMYRGRVAIYISNESQLDYKLAMVKKVISDAVGSTGMYYINASSPGMTSIRPVDSIDIFFNSPLYAENAEKELEQEKQESENSGAQEEGAEENGDDETEGSRES